MEKIMEINLTEVVLLNIKNREVLNKEKYYDGKYEMLLTYFLNKNFNSLFGKDLFANEEIEMLSTKEGIIINTTSNGCVLKISYVNSDNNFNIIGTMENREVFNIELSNNKVINRCLDDDNVIIYSFDENKYKYSYAINNEDGLQYQGSMVALNTRKSDYELYEYRNESEEVQKSDSFLQRIVDSITNGNFIKITTEYGEMTSDYVNEIYKKLIEESKKEELVRIKK